LIFADPDSLPTREIEKSFYDLHENDPDDVGYINFLKRLTEPLRQRLTPGMSGLDYGCGPGPAVARLLADAGVSVVNYDPIYANDQGALERCYDVVTCTEVVEHFHQPSIEWAKLFSLVKPGAWLGVMTCVVPDASPQGFRRWWYKGDPTHVSFYQRQTLEWIAARWQVAIDYLDDRVIIMRRLAD
jgi:2-polyprenyl-3-methyl-5-hydroxy-6-metoxy-1,4-benzoquinol methylase